MTPDEYLLSTNRFLGSYEDNVTDATKALLLLLLWRLRQSLIASLPDTGLSRRLLLTPLLQTFANEMQAYSATFLAILLAQLEEIDKTMAERAAAWAGLRLTPQTYRPRRGDDLLSTSRIGSRSLSYHFTPSPNTGYSPYTTGQVNSIQSKLLGALIREDPTLEIARMIVAERTSKGVIKPINQRGTIYNALRHRDRGLITNMIWEVAASAERAVFEPESLETPDFKGWRWHSLLDPLTCPVCRPLDGLIRQRYQDFPYTVPVHPFCRCRILPIP